MKARVSFLVILSLAVLLVACEPDPPPTEKGVITTDGAWSWWQAPRVLVDSTGKVVVASVTGKVGGGRTGRQQVSTLDPPSGLRRTDTIGGGLAADDHDAPAVVELPDGTIVATWTGHAVNHTIYMARRAKGSLKWELLPAVTRPEDPGASGNVTYSQLVYVPGAGRGGAGRLYDFYRGPEQSTAVMWSDDGASTWTYGGKVFGGGMRPYVQFAKGPAGRVHFVVTDGHPHDIEGNRLWSGFFSGTSLYKTDGTFVAKLGGTGARPDQFTPLYQGAPRIDGSSLSDTDGWTSQLVVPSNGRPVATFTVRRPAGTGPAPRTGRFSHQGWYAAWTGLRWETHPVAELGGELYEEQPDYTGLLALDPGVPTRTVLSSDVDPRSGTTTAHRELYDGRTADGGTTWTWTAITKASPADNIRPTIARGSTGRRALVWLRGRYTNFLDYRMQVRVDVE